MKSNIRHYFYLTAMLIAVSGTSLLTTSCGDDDMTKREADYDPRYKGTIAGTEADYAVEAEDKTLDINFKSDMDWTAAIVDAEGNDCSWASISPAEGKAGEELKLTVTMQENEDTANNRSATVTISTVKGQSQAITLVQK